MLFDTRLKNRCPGVQFIAKTQLIVPPEHRPLSKKKNLDHFQTRFGTTASQFEELSEDTYHPK